MNLRASKLLALALDPAAQPGEVETASIAFIRCLRDDPDTGKKLLSSLRSEHPKRNHSVMPFGKYKSMEISRIAITDPDYLEWILENADNLSARLRTVIEEELEKV